MTYRRSPWRLISQGAGMLIQGDKGDERKITLPIHS